jgi:hypothetical protein
MERLATVDWLLTREGTPPETTAILAALAHWPAGPEHARRKQAIFDARTIVSVRATPYSQPLLL